MYIYININKIKKKMISRNKIITIIVIIILVGLGLGLGLYFGLKNNSNSSNLQTPTLNIHNSDDTIDIWTPSICNEYREICQDRINKGLIPNTSMDGCLETMKVHQCVV